jgi:Arc/MetJ-type ribon-helix-helix transcriptional regulator
MEVMQISVSEAMREFLASQANKKGFASPTEFVEALLSDLQQRVAEKREIEAMLLEGIRSPSVVADAAFWEERRRKVLERDPELKT